MKLAATQAKGFRMGEGSRKNMSREERLAAKLRENLRRRKAQARAAGSLARDSDAANATESLPNPARES